MPLTNVSLAISGMSSPVGNDAVATLTATASTFDVSTPIGVTRVEFDLLYCPLTTASGQNALKQVVSTAVDTTAASTNQYSVTFAAGLFANPGLYQVRAKAIVGSGSPEVISIFKTALSTEIKVTETSPQTLDEAKTKIADHETRIDALENPPSP